MTRKLHISAYLSSLYHIQFPCWHFSFASHNICSNEIDQMFKHCMENKIFFFFTIRRIYLKISGKHGMIRIYSCIILNGPICYNNCQMCFFILTTTPLPKKRNKINYLYIAGKIMLQCAMCICTTVISQQTEVCQFVGIHRKFWRVRRKYRSTNLDCS